MTDQTRRPPDARPCELSGIEMHYGFVRALDGIDFHVMPGEVVGLLGDNGAGKSTLLKVMSGAHKPSHGSIRVRGEEHVVPARPATPPPPGIQMVYQDLALVEPQDISTNLNLGRETAAPRAARAGWASSTARRCASARRPSSTGSASAPRR